MAARWFTPASGVHVLISPATIAEAEDAARLYETIHRALANPRTLAQRVRATAPARHVGKTDQMIERALLEAYPGVFDGVPLTPPDDADARYVAETSTAIH